MVPAVACAANITVNSIGDTAANDGTCVLREAVTSANTNTASGGMANECVAGEASPTVDTISFDALFNGEVGDTIGIATPLTITEVVDISGGNCGTSTSPKPCAGLDRTGGLFGLQLDNADGSSVSGIALSGSFVSAISVINATTGFEASNNWIGLKLDQSASGPATGIFIDPDSDGATIGSGTPADRNVFANHSLIALDIQGADDGVVSGNYFGVMPDGTTQAANAINIEITASTASGGFAADGNVVGGAVTPAEAATPACDGKCNVISGAAVGIDLDDDAGEAPPTNTTISGNFIGLDATGTQAVENSQTGVDVENASEVALGGPDTTTRNHITGGDDGITTAGATNQLIQGNYIGVNSSGTAILDPPNDSGATIADATFADNLVAGDYEAGAANVLFSGILTGNSFGIGSGGEDLPVDGPAILLDENGCNSVVGGADAGEANVIGNVEGGDAAILVQGCDNAVLGNRIGIDAAGDAHPNEVTGILISGVLALRNVIGDDSSAGQNRISHNLGGAIEVSGGAQNNEILRNLGTNNDTLFVDVGLDGPGNGTDTQGGVNRPKVKKATTKKITGTAEPGAIVRLFQTKAQPGDHPDGISKFLGMDTANGKGFFKLRRFTKKNKRVTATQAAPDPPSLTDRDSSELSKAKKVKKP